MRQEGLPFVRGSDTSEAAAKSMDRQAPLSRESVFLAIQKGYGRRDGATCEEVERLCNLKHQSASARVRDLAKAGRIVDSGERRETSSGRKAVVWKVVKP